MQCRVLDQLSVQRRNVHVQMCQFAKFGVAGSNIHQIGEFHVKKVLPLFPVLLMALITGYPNGFCPPMVVIGPQSFSRTRPLVCLQPWKNKKRCKYSARAQHVQCALQTNLFIGLLDASVQLCQCAKFGVASSKIHKLGGSHV